MKKLIPKYLNSTTGGGIRPTTDDYNEEIDRFTLLMNEKKIIINTKNTWE